MPPKLYDTFGKRSLDILGSAIGLILLSPVFLSVAVAVRLIDGGPILFKQARVGKNFKPFKFLKFRTMVNGADSLGLSVTSGRDTRITPLGSFLRKTKLDEIPQLLNVLKGDISLVGPRPEVPQYVEFFEDDYVNILSVKPGITDYAALEFRNEEVILSNFENTEDAYIKEVLPRKIILYKRYIDEVSFVTDLKLIARTLWRVSFPKKKEQIQRGLKWD